jgi:hypothetical protein
VQPEDGLDAATAATKNAQKCPPSPYVLNQIQLNDINSVCGNIEAMWNALIAQNACISCRFPSHVHLQNKDNEELKRLGGVEGLAGALGSSITVGLDPEATGDGSLAAHAAAFGTNTLPERPAASFFALVGAKLSCIAISPLGFTFC